jgi:hypothetical protein
MAKSRFVLPEADASQPLAYIHGDILATVKLLPRFAPRRHRTLVSSRNLDVAPEPDDLADQEIEI